MKRNEEYYFIFTFTHIQLKEIYLKSEIGGLG